MKRFRPAKPVVLPFDGDLRIAVRPREKLGWRIFHVGCSDLKLASLLDACLKPGMVFCDVGAHVGQFTLMAAKRVGPVGHVYAIEATAATYAELLENIALNGCHWITPTQAAIYETSGTMELNVCGRGSAAFNSLSKPLRPEGHPVDVETVRTLSLDDFCKENRVGRIDFMKIDVNGPELQVLRGGRDTLSRPDAPSIYCEFDDRTASDLGYTTADLRREFEDLGYQLFVYDADRRRIVREPPRDSYLDGNILSTKNPDEFQAILNGSRVTTAKVASGGRNEQRIVRGGSDACREPGGLTREAARASHALRRQGSSP